MKNDIRTYSNISSSPIIYLLANSPSNYQQNPSLPIKQKISTRVTMSSFYNKYKRYFLNDDQPSPPLHRSYLKPYLTQVKSRPRSLQIISDSPLKYQSRNNHEFQVEIIPKLDELNRDIQRHKKDLIKKPSQYYEKDYQLENRNHAFDIWKREINNRIKNKQKLLDIFGYDPHTNKFNKCYNTIHYDHNPHNPQQQVFPQIQTYTFTPKYHRKYISRDEERLRDQIQRNHLAIMALKQNRSLNYKHLTQMQPPLEYSTKLPTVTDIRKDYGYPQTNDKLIDQQYSQNNQFKFINKKLHDIKWFEKYTPAYKPSTFYGMALIRRNQGKKNMNRRRHRLMSLLREDDRMVDHGESVG